MNRGPNTDVLEQITHSDHDQKVSVAAYGQFRQPKYRQKEPAMHAVISETNKGVKPTHMTAFLTIFVSEIHSKVSIGAPGTRSNFVLRSTVSAGNYRALPLHGDLRRNLYVLGLPFDLAKSEFTKIFEPYGTVTHAVILATLDSASRRRGFIVMSTHQEAKVAMDALSRTQIKGHMLDISWAVVQRSQGFLDGADRSMMLAISTPSIPERDGFSSVSGGSDDQINDRWELAHVPTSKLMVSNLSTILFTQVSDLHPLFYPFGPIKDINILGSQVGPLDTTITAMVEYVNVSNAQEAKEALQCQSYAGHPVEAHYLCDANSTTNKRSSSSPFLSGLFLGHGKSPDIGLNPFAIPFNIDSRISTRIYGPRLNAAIPSGLPCDAPLAPQPFPAHLRPYMMDSISRSSSATSSTWSHDSRQLRAPRASHLSVDRANVYTSYA